QWFSEQANPARIAHLRSVLDHLRADLVGFQEIESVRALRQVLDNGWDIAMADDAEEHQELALGVRRPFQLVGSELLFGGRSLDDFLPGRRDVLRAVVQTPEGEALVVYVVHMKSRRGGRRATDWQREGACGLLAAYLHGRPRGENSLVLGDFNDAPDDRSL